MKPVEKLHTPITQSCQLLSEEIGHEIGCRYNQSRIFWLNPGVQAVVTVK